MATIAERQRAGAALVLLLGAAVFLNYVDRGAIAIAAPMMKPELGLSNEAYGLAVSAFFWIYAPMQLFAGWLCDRFSVYKLMAGRHPAVGGQHLADGLCRRLCVAARAARHARRGREHFLPRQSKIIARHVPPERPRHGQRGGGAGDRHRSGGRHLAGGLILGAWAGAPSSSFSGVTPPVAGAVAVDRPRAADHRPS